MRKEEFSDVLGDIDDEFIEKARATQKAKKPAWVKWGAMAACLCLVAVGAVYTFTRSGGGTPVLQWSEGFEAASYFAYNDNSDAVSSSSSMDAASLPYDAERYFSDNRTQMEADGVIPEMADYPLFDCVARYNGDGSIFSVTFVWRQRGDEYSDLSITAGSQEVETVKDCIEIEIDDDGNIVPPAVTVTERDGVQIVAEGRENQDKTLTFRNDTGWYQIEGSWNDSYESVAELLDWVWEHPVDFDLFDMSLGVEYTYSDLNEYPDALADYIPDFSGLGYTLGENYVGLKDGEPIRFEGHYFADINDSQAEIHWCVDTEMDYYYQFESLGDISILTEELITVTLSHGSSFAFTIGDTFIQVYAKESQAHAAWLAVDSLR